MPEETHDSSEPHDHPDRSAAAEVPAGENAPESSDQRLNQELEEARAAADRFKDQFLRKAAEFENYRRRMETEISAIYRNANESLLLALLPVLDDFDRFLRHSRDQKDFDALVRGAELMYTKLSRVLEHHGLTQFASSGEPFNVDLHDALLQVPRSDVPPGTVVEEVERGYRLHDRVLRHAKVIVSSAPTDTNPQADESEENGRGQE
jgi:molecular chaperone GrpE